MQLFAKFKKSLWRGFRATLNVWKFKVAPNGSELWSAFHLNGKIGFPGGKPNGTGLSTGNFSKKREYLQRYSSFLVFTGITGKSLYHLLYRTECHTPWWKYAISLEKMVSSFMSQCPTCGWMPLWVIAVPLRLQVSVNCHKNTNIQGATFVNFNVFPCMRLISVWLANMPVLDARIYRFFSHYFVV